MKLIDQKVKYAGGKVVPLAEGDAFDRSKTLSSRIVCRARLTASVTGDITPEALITALPEGAAPAVKEMSFRLDLPAKQGVVIPAGVSYSAMAFPDNSADTAVRKVLFRALSLEYLWNEVRVKGGAYGTGAFMTASGEQSFFSYRDPSPAGAMTAYEGSADFLRSYCAEQPDISSYIISSIAQKEPLMSDAVYGSTADELYFRGITEESRRDIRRRMLALTSDDLLRAA